MNTRYQEYQNEYQVFLIKTFDALRLLLAILAN